MKIVIFLVILYFAIGAFMTVKEKKDNGTEEFNFETIYMWFPNLVKKLMKKE